MVRVFLLMFKLRQPAIGDQISLQSHYHCGGAKYANSIVAPGICARLHLGPDFASHFSLTSWIPLLDSTTLSSLLYLVPAH